MPTAKVASQMLQDFLDAFNAHDVDAVLSFFSEDCVFDMPRGPAPGGRRLVGKDEIREGFGPDSRGSRTSVTATIAIGSAVIEESRSGRSAARRSQANPSRCEGAICSSSATARSAGRTPTGRSSTDWTAVQRR
jgi:hypothetical protein